MTLKITVSFIPSSNPQLFKSDRDGEIAKTAVRLAAQAWSNFLTEPSPTKVLAGTNFDFSVPQGSPFNPDPNWSNWYRSTIQEPVGFDGIKIYVTEQDFGSGNGFAAGAIVGKFSANQQDKKIDYEHEKARTNGSIKFLPSAGQVFFNTRAAQSIFPIKTFALSEENLLYLIALHEIGHLLGFYSSEATKSKIVNNRFLGTNITFPDNIFIQDDKDGFHLAPGTKSTIYGDTKTNPNNGESLDNQKDLLVPQLEENDIKYTGISLTDIKFLADLGYTTPASLFLTNLYSYGPISNIYGLSIPYSTISSSYNGIVSGTGGNDSITGNIADEFIAAGPGNDTIVGSEGRDSLFGGDGNDRLLGGGGNDTLNGGAGNDILIGGLGTNNLQGFNINTPNPTEVDTLLHSANSLNRFFLAEGTVNGYTQGGNGDYARIQNFLPGPDILLVADPSNIARALVGSDTYIYERTLFGFGRELIAIVENITNPNSIDIRPASTVTPLP